MSDIVEQGVIPGTQPRRRASGEVEYRGERLPAPLATNKRILYLEATAIRDGCRDADVDELVASILLATDQHWLRAHDELVKAMGEVYPWEWDDEQ